jgi:beta-glucanase (GH16 family)
MTHSWSNNLAMFSSESVEVSGGTMTLTLLDAPDGLMDGGEVKQFLGAEVRSVDAITYGRVRARAKLASGSAVISALVTIYTPWPADNWNELDIECLGADPSEVQTNAMVYTGALPAPSTPVSPTQHPEIGGLGFDGSLDFHTYEIEWTPASATFRVDGAVQRVWTDRMDLMTLPQNILLTIWASGDPAWAGAVGNETLGAHVVYDWVEVYEYDGN